MFLFLELLPSCNCVIVFKTHHLPSTNGMSMWVMPERTVLQSGRGIYKKVNGEEGRRGYINQFRPLTKKRCLLGFGLLVFLTISYHVIIPYIVDIFALPLFCDESSPCQNQSVSLYSHNLASGRVTTCHFKNDFAIAVIG